MRVIRSVATSVLVLSVGAMLATGADSPAAPAAPPNPNEGRLKVTEGGRAGNITSETDLPDGRTVLHGVQVLVDSENRLKESTVFNKGLFQSRTQFYTTGLQFRFQRREHNGDGYEIVSTPDLTRTVAEKVIVDGGTDIGPIKVQEELARGIIKEDKCWSGTFLRWQRDPGRFSESLVLKEYREGKFVGAKPFEAKLPLAPDGSHKGSAGWPWNWQYDQKPWPAEGR